MRVGEHGLGQIGQRQLGRGLVRARDPEHRRGTRIDAGHRPRRLMAVADVYDALTTKRFYKDAFSHTKARQIILNLKGSHFDPEVVDAFLALEGEFDRIREERLSQERNSGSDLQECRPANGKAAAV